MDNSLHISDYKPMQENIIFSLNGEQKHCPKNTNFLQLLNLLELEPRSLAIELNRAILPKNEWESKIVQNNDMIEIVQFVGGGI